MPRAKRMHSKIRSKSRNDATTKASTTVTTNDVLRSKLVATHSGTAATGSQNSGSAVNSNTAFETMASRPMAASSPP